MQPEVQINGENLQVCFDQYDTAAYAMFLKVKRLPEYHIGFNQEAFNWTITAPARFAGLLGVSVVREQREGLPMCPDMFDDQRYIVEMALGAKRFACWSDCGLGKTLAEGRNVIGFELKGSYYQIACNNVIKAQARASDAKAQQVGLFTQGGEQKA